MAPESKRKKSPFRFDDKELSEPALRKPIRKVSKAADKLDKAESKIPIKKVLTVERATDAQSGKSAARLRFGDVPSTKPSEKLLSDTLHTAPMMLTRGQSEGKNEDGSISDIGKEAVASARGLGETGFRLGKRHTTPR